MSLRDLAKRGNAVPVGVIGRRDPFLFSADATRLFNDFLQDHHLWSGAAKLPSLDIIENESEYRVKAELPGLGSEDVDITVENNCLTVKGEKKESHEDKGDNYIRQECFYGSFHRSIALPDIADGGQAKATFKKGILTIIVPKKVASAEKSKKVKVEDAA